MMNFMYDRCTGGAVVAVNWYGEEIFARGYGRSAGRSTPGRPAVSCGPTNPTAGPVWPDSPVRIGSNTKAINAAMVRDRVLFRLQQAGRIPAYSPAIYGPVANWYAEVQPILESVRILDAQLNLLPVSLRNILGNCTFVGPQPNNYICSDGTVAPPVNAQPNDNTSPANCGTAGVPACRNGATQCTPTGPNTAACTCAPGFAGATCTILTGGPALATNGADRRWQQITLGTLFRHDSGLPRNNVSTNFALQNLATIRAMYDPTFADLDNVGPTLASLGVDYDDAPDAGGPARLLAIRPSPLDFLIAEAGSNLRFTPGQVSVYSNLGFIVLQLIVEYTSGDAEWRDGDVWGGALDHYSHHLSSPLDNFVGMHIAGAPEDVNAWGSRRSRFGMFSARSPNVAQALYQQTDPFELEPRDWINGVLNPPQVDDKGIICEVTALGACDFATGVVDYFGNPGLVKYGHHSGLQFMGAGGIVTEAHLYLRFMRKFLVGFSSFSPDYGRRRVSWDMRSAHNGQWLGATSHVRQVGWRESVAVPQCTHRNAVCDSTNPAHQCCSTGFECVAFGHPSFNVTPAQINNQKCVQETTYAIPLVNATTGDYTADASSAGTGSCVLPRGLDVFVAVNQASDNADLLGNDYDFLPDAVIRGLCEVDWPVNPHLFQAANQKVVPKSP
jgi:hypothetical protein